MLLGAGLLAGYLCFLLYRFVRDSVSFFGRLIIICSAFLATLSLFAAWVDIPLAKDLNGYSTPAPLLILLWWHPLIGAVKNIKLNPKTAYSSAATAVIFGFGLYYLISQHMLIKTGGGLVLFSISTLIFLYGVRVYIKDQNEADSSSIIDEKIDL